MDNKKLKELKELQEQLETESLTLVQITDTFRAIEIAQSEGASELPEHALFIPTMALKQVTQRIEQLSCDMRTMFKEVTGNVKAEK